MMTATSEKDAQERDAILSRMLRTPPQPHKAKEAAKAEAKAPKDQGRQRDA